MSANPSNVTQINCTVYNGVPSLLASLNVWIPGRSEPAFMTGAASFLYNLENILIAAKPTPNSVIFVYEVALQRLVAASGANATVNMTAVTSKVGNPRYTPVDTIHAPTAGVGKALVDLYGGLDKVPRNNGTVVMASPDINGEPWFVNTVYLAVPPHDWQLVIAMPRKDFFSKIDKAQKTSIIVAVVVAVSGAFTVSLAAFASLRPLHQLAVSMKQLTKFDFSSLEGGVLDNRSLIREIRHVQETFSAMVNAFSVSIKKNRSLMAGGTMSGSAGGAAASGTRNPASSSG
ncbi:hypothetical protein HK104_007900 [Borealophlyctis nickersoniae]|nr:hypothetical protein HK104_007900 [Borealophlyctis nickersoniae]